MKGFTAYQMNEISPPDILRATVVLVWTSWIQVSVPQLPTKLHANAGHFISGSTAVHFDEGLWIPAVHILGNPTTGDTESKHTQHPLKGSKYFFSHIFYFSCSFMNIRLLSMVSFKNV